MDFRLLLFNRSVLTSVLVFRHEDFDRENLLTRTRGPKTLVFRQGIL